MFYDAAGKATGAIEVCFSCTGIRAFPDIPEPQWYRQNFVQLARLIDSLGLWNENRTVKAYEALLKEREAGK